MAGNAATALIRAAARLLFALSLLVATSVAHAQVTLTRGTNFSVDVGPDGRIAMDLLGSIWLLPPRGGQATAITIAGDSAWRPRWSPDGSLLLYERHVEGQSQIWLLEFDDGSTRLLGDGRNFDLQADWHPDADRIVFASERGDSGFDLWELDLATGLSWRISSLAGDETEPVWSEDGRDLAYIHHGEDGWTLMLRRKGQPDRALVQSASRLSSPSWRPDGSLITYTRHGEDVLSIDMVILSDPLLVRPLVTGEDFFVAPVAWRDRSQLLYTAGGGIWSRDFNSWTSRTVPFRATINPPDQREPALPARRELPATEEPSGKLVIRAGRMFDGTGTGYRQSVDILIDGGKIAAVEEQEDRSGTIVVDMADLTVLPGYIDAHAHLPTAADQAIGPILLSLGVTTVVVDREDASKLDKLWSGKELPGPRVLGPDWVPDLRQLPSVALGRDSLPVSPAGIRYENVQVSGDDEAVMLLSGLADARTGGIDDLLRVRQAGLLGADFEELRRYVAKPRLDALAPPIAIGSFANGLPPGLALHAEFRSLAEAGLRPDQVLKTAGVNAATALGLGLRAGRIATGSTADLVIVDGDPLKNISATLNVVAVVRNGRFYSAVGLLDKARQFSGVE